MVDVAEVLEGVVAVALGAFLLFVLLQSFSEAFPEFATYAGLLMGAFIAGAVAFFKFKLFS